MIKLILFLTTVFACCFTFAAGNFSLSGKLRSFSQQTVEIDDSLKTYSIDRKKLGPEQSMKVVQGKIGSTVQIQVPFDALLNVKILQK